MNFDKVLTSVFGSSNERFLKSIRPIIEQINAFEPQIQKLSDEQLRERTAFFKAQIADEIKDARDKDDRKYREQEVLNEILPEAFALVREGVGSPCAIDKAMRLAGGNAQGPLEWADAIGLDNLLQELERLEKAYGERYRPNPLLTQYVRAGRTGKRAKRGVYQY